MPVTTTETIDRGDTRTLTVQILASDILVDPDALTLTIRTPAGVSTTYTYGVGGQVVRDSEGVYHSDVTFTEAGAWTYEWRSTAPTQVQGETLQISPSPLDILAGTTARDRLAQLVAAGVAPTLTDGQLDDILIRARRPDVDGLLPSDADWTPTYDFNAAASEGWELKAGLAVTFDFTAHGQTFDRSQVQEQCLAMASRYRRGSGSVRIASAIVDDFASGSVSSLALSYDDPWA